MAVASNQGIILAANGDASGGNVSFGDPPFAAAEGGTLAQRVSPGSALIDVSTRVALTLAFGFSLVDHYDVIVRLTNTNKFQALAGGFALPALTGGAVDTDLDQAIDILTGAQNNVATKGTLAIEQVYTFSDGLTSDILYLPGGLVGVLTVLLNTVWKGAQPSTAADYFKISVDSY